MSMRWARLGQSSAVDVSFRSEKLKTSKCFQRAELFGRQVLKLVDKKRDRHTGVLRGLSDRHDQRREVRLNVAAIGQAIFRIDAEAYISDLHFQTSLECSEAATSFVLGIFYCTERE